MQRDDKQTVIKAIAELGHRVTAADVASKTGLSLAVANSTLNTIAAEAGGHLEVSEAGDIAYRFKNGFQTAYLATGARAILTLIWSKIFAVILYLLKISFGLFLIISLTIVVIAFGVLTMVSSGLETNNDKGIRDLQRFLQQMFARGIVFWRSADKHDKRSDNFFTDCFSFLFGDGDPNAHLEESKWQLAAKTIRENGGVVMKEQLAPFLGAKLDDADSILPILSRFDGRPVVTANGNIAYIFPSLQVTTEHKASEQTNLLPDQNFLAENLWTFSAMPESSLKAVYVIASLNLFGTWWMFLIFNKVFHLSLVWTQVLVVYGTLFVLIPTFRQLWQNRANRQIEIRNRERMAAAALVAEPDEEMQQKLAERLKYNESIELRAVPEDHLAYTTDQDQKTEKQND